MTSVMDFIEEYLSNIFWTNVKNEIDGGDFRNSKHFKTCKYLRLDGKTTNRQELLNVFNTDPEIMFFLLSTRAGGFSFLFFY
jgi:SNF2 family DNA or RNA helicase